VLRRQHRNRRRSLSAPSQARVAWAWCARKWRNWPPGRGGPRPEHCPEAERPRRQWARPGPRIQPVSAPAARSRALRSARRRCRRKVSLSATPDAPRNARASAWPRRHHGSCRALSAVEAADLARLGCWLLGLALVAAACRLQRRLARCGRWMLPADHGLRPRPSDHGHSTSASAKS